MFVRRYIFLFPIALYCLYKTAFVRKNRFSDRNELKIIGKPFEVSVVGSLLSTYIKKKKGSLFYKQDTEESQLATKCLNTLTDANNLGQILPIKSV